MARNGQNLTPPIGQYSGLPDDSPGGPVPAAIVGLGRIASLLEDDALREKPCTHAGAIFACPDCTLTAGADTSAERRRLFAERWNVPVYDNAATMLAERSCKILCVATHPDSHLFYCNLAARMGVPVVICEKPLADSLRSARKIAALASKTRIVVNHERRYAADYNEARSILMNETLGRTLSVKATLFMGKNRRLIDVLWHDGTHLADAIMFLCGVSLRHERRCGAAMRSTDGTAFLYGNALGFRPNGEPASMPFCIETGAGRDHLVFEIDVSCEAGRLLIGNGVFEVYNSAPSAYAERFRSLAKARSGFEGLTGYFSGMLADAVSCARDETVKPVSGAEQALAVIEYLSQIR
ncbi:MAG: Gfo/Idh/MocA family oxidoreductase [Spirochaetaceae bacterium]|jgi:predicted dehydrogenase|nr:Gfo/Idh/MocA family oxidoreductase [Spirochaetaceae bacterium]